MEQFDIVLSIILGVFALITVACSWGVSWAVVRNGIKQNARDIEELKAEQELIHKRITEKSQQHLECSQETRKEVGELKVEFGKLNTNIEWIKDWMQKQKQGDD